MRLQSKKGKENFKEVVKKCIDNRENKKLSRHARQYICAYYKIYHEQKNHKQQQQHQTYQVDESMTPVKLEKLVKESKPIPVLWTLTAAFVK
jgi:hypothetical protein